MAQTPELVDEEKELIAAAQRGDRRALADLLTRYEGRVYRFCVQFCRDPEDAREVMQETLLAAARTATSYRGEASMGTWLYTIARSFCIKRRRRGRAPQVSLEAADREANDVVDPAARPDEVAGSHELTDALERAIESLAPGYREVLVLRDVEGLTAPEVADALGINVPAVKSRLHRARAAVREMLAPVVGAVAAPLPGCPDVIGLFSRRLEGEVDANLCAEMEKHLAGCPRCTAACDGLRRTLTLCRSAPAARVPAQVQASVRRAVRDLLSLEG